MNPRVFIIQQPRPKDDGWTPNFDSATKFGTLHFIFDMNDRAYADPTGARKKIIQKLADFDPQRDFLLNAGFGDPHCPLLVAQMVGGYFRFASVKWLYWSRGRTATGMSNDHGYYFEAPLPCL